MDAYVEVIREDGTLERHRIEGDQITVGRSPTAGVPIPDARDLEPEHLRRAPRGEGCWVALAQGSKIGARVRGAAFQHGMVAWGTEIEIGKFKIRITDQLASEKKGGGGDEKKTSPVVLLAGVAAVAILAWTLTQDAVGNDLDTVAPEDELHIFPSDVTCPVTGAGVLARADLDAEAALAKSERYPFDPSDGVESVTLYRQASSCYQGAGVADAATRMQEEATWMQRRIDDDYLSHRFRLERAIEQQRHADALLETRSLLALTRHLDHPYVQWLTRLERQLQLIVEAQGARRH